MARKIQGKEMDMIRNGTATISIKCPDIAADYITAPIIDGRAEFWKNGKLICVRHFQPEPKPEITWGRVFLLMALGGSIGFFIFMVMQMFY